MEIVDTQQLFSKSMNEEPGWLGDKGRDFRLMDALLFTGSEGNMSDLYAVLVHRREAVTLPEAQQG